MSRKPAKTRKATAPRRSAKAKGPGPGRPRTTGKGQLVGLRCHADFLSRVDEWRRSQADAPTRNAAIVRLAEGGLSAAGA
jgi:hypothetical protein